MDSAGPVPVEVKGAPAPKTIKVIKHDVPFKLVHVSRGRRSCIFSHAGMLTWSWISCPCQTRARKVWTAFVHCSHLGMFTGYADRLR